MVYTFYLYCIISEDVYLHCYSYIQRQKDEYQVIAWLYGPVVFFKFIIQIWLSLILLIQLLFHFLSAYQMEANNLSSKHSSPWQQSYIWRFDWCPIVFLRVVYLRSHLRSVVPEVGIKGRDKSLHPTVSVGCNYLPLPIICAYGTTLLIYWVRGRMRIVI